MPKRTLFFGPGEAAEFTGAAAATGAAGAGLVAGESFHPSAGKYFGIPESVRSEFAAAIRKSGKFTVKNEGPADAELRLEVTGYGFHAPGPFARGVKPVLSVEATLVRPDGSVAWTFGSAVNHLAGDETPEVMPEQARNNPEVAANAFRRAAFVIAVKAGDALQQ